MIHSLAQAVRATSCASIAFVGAGGKTTGMFQLARELAAPVIVTATSHLGAWQTELADQHFIAENPATLEELEHRLKGVILITGGLHGDKTTPVNDSVMHRLEQFCGDHAIPLLIEADGSKRKPIKAWAEHEPPIPAFVKQVVQVVGMSVIGKPLSDEFVHRPELFSRLCGRKIGDIITAADVLHVLAHRDGGLRNIPVTARKFVLLNQADTAELQSSARGFVPALLASYDSVIISSLKEKQIFAVHEPVAGIVLAAGESTRYGQPKQLLDWRGQPFVRAVATTALEAGLSPVIIVTGAHAEQIEEAVQDLDVILVHNSEWKSGQASSIRAGIKAVKDVGSAIFLLTDQPQVTTSILRALIEKHAEGLHSIVAPLVLDQRANPVLFDRTTFKDLLSIEGDTGGRAIFHKHRVDYLPWHDDRLLLDVDTPEMYQRLISDETL
jgi:molybdenum cofactor cytidylyltransferase